MYSMVTKVNNTYCRDFPGGAVVKNLPANAGGHGFNSWSGKILHAAEQQLLSLCSRTCEPQLLSPHATTTEARAPTAHVLQ